MVTNAMPSGKKKEPEDGSGIKFNDFEEPVDQFNFWRFLGALNQRTIDMERKLDHLEKEVKDRLSENLRTLREDITAMDRRGGDSLEKAVKNLGEKIERLEKIVDSEHANSIKNLDLRLVTTEGRIGGEISALERRLEGRITSAESSLKQYFSSELKSLEERLEKSINGLGGRVRPLEDKKTEDSARDRFLIGALIFFVKAAGVVAALTTTIWIMKQCGML